MKLFKVAVVPFLFALSALGADNSVITYQGRILKSDGKTPVDALASFQFVIRSPNNCILWTENQTIDMRNSGGGLTAQIGGQTNLSPGMHIFSQIFQNSGSLTGLSGCNAGSTYSPGPNDDRTLYVSFDDGEGLHSVAAMAIKAVPYSMFSAVSTSSLTMLGKLFDVAQTPTNNQFMRFNSVSDRWEPRTIVAADVSGLGAAATMSIGQGSNSVAAGNDARFPSTSCSIGEKSRWDGSAWLCEPDADSGSAGVNIVLTGPVTGVTAAGTIATTIEDNSIQTNHAFPNVGHNRLVATDPTTGSALVPFECTPDQIPVWHITDGWVCKNQAALTVGTIAASSIVGSIGVAQGGTGTNTLPACGVNEALKYDGSVWSCVSLSGGSVEEVVAGAGLNGGSIVSVGTISVNFGSGMGQVAAGNDARFPSGVCASGYFSRWDGSAWQCEPDSGAGGGITSITAGNGLLGGTILSVGTVEVNFGTVAGSVVEGNDARVSITACSAGNYSRWDGSAWVCAPDANTGLGSGTVGVAQGGTGVGTLPSCGMNQALKYDGSVWTCVSYGSVTQVTAGLGLLGGTINGGGTISVSFGTLATTAAIGNDSRFPSSLCAPGNYSRWDGSAWQCDADATGGGGGGSGFFELTGDVTGSGTGTANVSIANGAVRTAHMFANPGVRRLVATDAGTGSTLTPLACAPGQLINWDMTLGFVCTSPAMLSVGTASVALMANSATSAENVSGTVSIANGGTGTNMLPTCTPSEALSYDGSAWSCVGIAGGGGGSGFFAITGDVVGSGFDTVNVSIAAGAIVNNDINAAAGIVDTKLATISTAGKVSNSATTATTANTANAIVARDANGNFTAGTISASFIGNGSGITNIPATSIAAGGTISATFVGDGSGITNISTTNLSGTLNHANLGVVPVSHGGTGVATLPSCGMSEALKFDGSAWSCINVSGGGGGGAGLAELTGDVVATGSGTVSATIQNNAVTNAKINDGAVTSAKILDGEIVNADINAAAAIADTKLATISTAGKVSNSATTATSANTASAIVARDGSGNFSAGTVSATFNGNGANVTSINANNIASGTIATAILGQIPNSSLVTINTAGKVANAATTATSANTASAIVARDASGNFTAGTITATTFSGSGSGLTGVPGTMPPGAVIAMASTTCPTGYLVANGASVSRATYPDLFTAIGVIYGSASGSTFNLPDYRGLFMRGLASGSTNDPDRATRTNRGDGTGGDVVGSRQADQNESHVHSGATLSGAISSSGAHTHPATGLTASASNESAHTHSGTSLGGSATSAGAHTHPLTGSTTVADTSVTGNTGSWDDENNAGSLIRSLSATSTNRTVDFSVGSASSAGAHTHPLSITGNTGAGSAHTHSITVSGSISSSGAHTHSATISGNTDTSGGSEARPLNIYVLYCIKQ